MLIALYPPPDHILPPLPSCAPPRPPKRPRHGHHPPTPSASRTLSHGLKGTAGWGGGTPLSWPRPHPAHCLSHLQLLEQQVGQDAVAESGHSVQSAGCSFPSRLTLRGSHPGQALRQSPVGISGTKSQGASTSQPNCLDLSPMRRTLFCGAWGRQVRWGAGGSQGLWGDLGAEKYQGMSGGLGVGGLCGMAGSLGDGVGRKGSISLATFWVREGMLPS